jgi:hypothetical protein
VTFPAGFSLAFIFPVKVQVLCNTTRENVTQSPHPACQIDSCWADRHPSGAGRTAKTCTATGNAAAMGW